MEETILKLIIKGVIQGTGSYLASEFLKKTFTNPVTKQILDDLIYSINPFVNNLKGNFSVSSETIIYNQELLNQYTDEVLKESNKNFLIRKQTNDFLKSILIKDWFVFCKFLFRAGLLVEAEKFYLGYKNVLGKNSYDLACWLEDLSLVYNCMGKNNKQLECLTQSVRIFNKLSKSRSYKKSLSFQESYAVAIYKLAETYIAKEDYNKAMSFLKKGKLIMPLNSIMQPMFELGMLSLHIEKKQLKRAEKYIEKLDFHYQNNDKEVYNYIAFLYRTADVYINQKRDVEAEEKLIELKNYAKEKVITLDYDQFALAFIYAKIGKFYKNKNKPDLAKALKYTNKALKSLRTVFYYELNNTVLIQVEEIHHQCSLSLHCQH